MKVRDPDTGKRAMQPRPPQDGVWTDAPELQSSRNRYLTNAGEPNVAPIRLSGGRSGSHPKYLRTGLVRCGEYDANYVVTMKRPKRHAYECANHKERGAAVTWDAPIWGCHLQFFKRTRITRPPRS